MKLRLEDITAEAKEVSFAEPASEINRILGQGPIREYQVEQPIDVTMSYYRAGTDLFFDGRLSAQVDAVCARCAENFDASNDRAFRYILAPKAAGYGDDKTSRAEDLELSVYEGDEVDLAPLVREQLLLSFPTRPLCREDCHGMCPHCGINLNRGQCQCRTETFDPRLAALRELKIRSKTQ